MIDFILTIPLVLLVLSVPALLIWIRYEDYREKKELQKKYNVDKFPVTSKSNTEYFVEIKYEPNCSGNFVCNIYKRVVKKNGKTKDIHLDGDYFSLKESEYDYIAIATKVINCFEIKLEHFKAEDLKKEQLLQENKEKWQKWDGIIN